MTEKKKELAPLTKTLKVTDRQLGIIQSALELYDRLLMGQIESSLWRHFISRDIEPEAFGEACRKLKQIIFPELSQNSFYGVGWREGDSRQNRSQTAYEIEGMIRHLEWKRKPDREPYLTCASPPLHYSTESLIELDVIEKSESN